MAMQRVKDDRLLPGYDSGRPFAESWLNTAFLDTLLPHSKWQKVHEMLSENLAWKVRTQFEHEDRKQVLLHLLGEDFVHFHFPDQALDASVVSPPKMSIDQRRRLQEEAQTWLQIQMKKVAEETACMRPDDAARKGIPLAPEMFYYVNQCVEIFQNAMEKEMIRKELKHVKESQRRRFRERTNRGRDGGSQASDDQRSAVDSVPENVLPRTPDISPIKGPTVLAANAPMFSSIHSEHLSEGVVALLARDPTRFKEITAKLSGRRLPQTMRRHLWRHTLCEPERIAMKENNIGRLLRERFGKAVARGVTELGIQRATQSPVNSVIENAVIEQYERCPGMATFCVTPSLTEAVRALNVLYVYNRNYDPHLTLWLFPIQLAFKTDDEDPAAHIYELALLLSQLTKDLYPAWSAVFAMAERVMSLLEEADPEFYRHLNNVSTINFNGTGKDFLVHLISMERTKALATMSPSNTPTQAEVTRSVLADPLLFIRKWIGEGFVSVLGYQATLFFWDQMMMETFKPSVFEDMALAILLLSRNVFLSTHDYPSLKKAFIQHPSDLYTADIIRAWVWLHRGGNPANVPDMNRRPFNIEHTETIVSESLPPPTPIHPRILPPFGINEIQVKFISSINTQEKASWVKKFGVQKIKLRFKLYYGTSLLRIQETVGAAREERREDRDNTKTISFSFPYDSIIFENIDISQYDIEREMEAIPYLVISSDFIDIEKAPLIRADNVYDTGSAEVILGWSLASPYDVSNITDPDEKQAKMKNMKAIRQSPYMGGSIDEDFTVLNSRYIYPIHAGLIPEDPLAFEEPQVNDPSELLNIGSELTLHLFDSRFPPSRLESVAPTPPPPIIPIPRQAEPKRMTPKPPPQKAEPPPKEEVPEVGPKPAPPTPIIEPWVPFKPQAAQALDPPPCKNSQAFCIYFDQLRFMPDNATIFKITGRFFKSGVDEEIPDILVFPDVESQPRSPTIRASARVIINLPDDYKANSSSTASKKGSAAYVTGKHQLSTETLVIVRVYTILKRSLQIVVVGNFILRIFNNNGDLLVGGYQRRLRNQLPEVGLIGINNLKEDSLVNAPYIPCVSITYRLLPYTDRTKEAPDYHSCYYRSAETEPSPLEWKVFKLYMNDKEYPTNFRDVVRDLKFRDGTRDTGNKGVSSIFMLGYIPDRLDITKHLPPNTAPKHINTSLMFNYRLEKGMKIKVERAYALTDGLLTFAVARIIPGKQSSSMEPSIRFGYGLDTFTIFADLDPSSKRQSPIWLDQYELIRPYVDPNALLIVQIFGLDLDYKDGKFLNKNGTAPVLTKEHQLGWAAFNIFEINFVHSGRHLLPVYGVRLHMALMERFQKYTISKILKTEKQFEDVDTDSVVISVMDGHDEKDALGEDYPIHTDIIEANPEKAAAYKIGMANTDGDPVYKTLLESLPPGTQPSSGVFNNAAKKFRTDFIELANQLVENVPKKKPYKPLFVI